MPGMLIVSLGAVGIQALWVWHTRHWS